jgi:hypothetical protein
MQKLKTIIFILIISFFFRCANNSDPFFDPTYWSSPYKGITVTDKYGFILKEDNSDWCSNKLGLDMPNEFKAFFPAYPNPVASETETITFLFYVNQDTRVKLLINDGDYVTIIILTDSVYSRRLHEFNWDLRAKSGLKVPGGIYRCYMYAPDFICHGDIWIK